MPFQIKPPGANSFIATGVIGATTVFIVRDSQGETYRLHDGTPVSREFKGSYFYSPSPGVRVALRSTDPNAP